MKSLTNRSSRKSRRTTSPSIPSKPATLTVLIFTRGAFGASRAHCRPPSTPPARKRSASVAFVRRSSGTSRRTVLETNLSKEDNHGGQGVPHPSRDGREQDGLRTADRGRRASPGSAHHEPRQ